MPVSGEQVLAIADRYDVALNGAEDKVIRKVQDALETAYLQMERELVRAYDDNAKNLSLLPQQRALLIQQEIAEQLNRLDGDTQSLYAADFERMIRQSYGSGRDMAAELALAIADERLQSFAAVPLSAVRFAAENATSRLKNHTKRLRDQIATNISAGIALGSSSRKVAEQLRGELGLTKTRAEMIARTETLAAHNEAAKDAYQRNGIELVIWLATSDERICRFCGARNGNAYALKEVQVPVHPRCLPAGVIVSTPNVKAGTSREYRGQVVRIKTASGKELTATPNHPILTENGWVSIGLLNEGDRVLSSLNGQRVIDTIAPNEQARPAAIEKIVASVGESSGVSPVSVKVSPEDFHGDGEGSEVCVIRPHGLLRNQAGAAQLFHHPHEIALKRGLVTALSLLARRLLTLGLPGQRLALECPSCSLSSYSPLLSSHLSPFGDLGLRLATPFNSRLDKPVFYDRTRDAKLLGNLILRDAIAVELDDLSCINTAFQPTNTLDPISLQDSVDLGLPHTKLLSQLRERCPGLVTPDEIVSVATESFSGHVYNLETETGWYFANNILTHNCRCTVVPYKPEWERAGLVDVDFYKRHRAKGLKELEESGRSPNYGPGPFEKKKKAPKTALNLGDAKPFPKKKAKPSEPTITVEELTQSIKEQTSKVNAAQSKAFKALQSGEPSEELQQIFADESNKLLSLQNQLKELEASQAKQKQKAKSKERKRVEALFPDSIGGLKEVRPLGGSTGAMLVEDPATGRKFVLKRGNSPDHLREEFNADKAYKALGVPVPEVKLYETGNGPVKLAEFIEGESLDSVLSKGGKAAEKAKAEIQKHFAVDALMANWDVVGLNADNILIDKKGIPYRINNGGSLRFRAQGATKNKDWNRYPDELWTLRQPSNSASSAFDTMSFSQAMEQVERIDVEALKKALPKELHDTIQGRYEEMARLADISRTMFEDKWKEDYVDGFTRQIIGIRQAGISGRMPEKLRWTGAGTAVYDENNKRFDDLRSGQKGLIGQIAEYIEGQGGDYRHVSGWMSAQAGDSWNAKPKTLKYYMTQQRDVSLDEYYWQDLEGIKNNAPKFIDDSYRTTMQAHHAFQYELMDNIDFDGRNSKTKTVRLIRTENEDAIQGIYGLKPGDKGKVIKKGPIESTSIYQRVEVFGSELTVQDVPYHRVFGNYFAERSPGYGDGAFMSDGENEFVVMMEGIPLDYLKSPDDFKPPVASAGPNVKAKKPKPQGQKKTQIGGISKEQMIKDKPPSMSDEEWMAIVDDIFG